MYYKYWELFLSFEVWWAINAERLDEISFVIVADKKEKSVLFQLYTWKKWALLKKKSFSLSASDPGGGSTMSVSRYERSLQDISEILAVEGEISALPSWEVAQVVQVS